VSEESGAHAVPHPLADPGYQPVTVDVSEFRKLEGRVTRLPEPPFQRRPPQGPCLNPAG
jgi:hypothetical protein